MSRRMRFNGWVKPLLLAGLSIALVGCDDIPQNKVPVGEAVTKSPCGALTFAGFPSFEPVAPKNTYFLCHQGTASLFNGTTRTALWTVEHLKADDLNQNVAPPLMDYRTDPQLPFGVRNEFRHFNGTNGKYKAVPLADPSDFTASPGKVNQAFYLSNWVAATPGMRKAWGVLGYNVREWAKQRGEVYVISGPIFSNNEPKEWIGILRDEGRHYSEPSAKQIRSQQMAVPTHLFKVILDPARRQATAFIVPVDPMDASVLPQVQVPVVQVEQVTHLRFFPALDMGTQGQLKTQRDPAAWPITMPPAPPSAPASASTAGK